MSDESVSDHSYRSSSSSSSLSDRSSFSSICSATPIPVFPQNYTRGSSETIPRRSSRGSKSRTSRTEFPHSPTKINRDGTDDIWDSESTLDKKTWGKNNRDSTDSGYNEGYMDVPRALLRRKSSTMHAKCFFVPFCDRLRVDNFSLEFPTLERSEIRKKNTKTTISSKPRKSSIDHPVPSPTEMESKTIEQLLFLRSRLTPERRKMEPSCNGYFGCDCEEHVKPSTHEESIETTSPAWV